MINERLTEINLENKIQGISCDNKDLRSFIEKNHKKSQKITKRFQVLLEFSIASKVSLEISKHHFEFIHGIEEVMYMVVIFTKLICDEKVFSFCINSFKLQ